MIHKEIERWLGCAAAGMVLMMAGCMNNGDAQAAPAVPIQVMEIQISNKPGQGYMIVKNISTETLMINSGEMFRWVNGEKVSLTNDLQGNMVFEGLEEKRLALIDGTFPLIASTDPETTRFDYRWATNEMNRNGSAYLWYCVSQAEWREGTVCSLASDVNEGVMLLLWDEEKSDYSAETEVEEEMIEVEEGAGGALEQANDKASEANIEGSASASVLAVPDTGGVKMVDGEEIPSSMWRGRVMALAVAFGSAVVLWLMMGGKKNEDGDAVLYNSKYGRSARNSCTC